ncbi:MAG: type II toxin-antitoxin system VapB family antitoxin [Chthoniobacterales bacterium]|nr:type II toxin-antitoxin system VapB family antitoxin [Chthoniobacterales bacterium]
MATNLQIDQSLLEQAKSLAGFPTKRETVNEALKEFIQSRLRRQLLQLRGQIEYFEDYDYKALRRVKNL